MQLKPLLSRLFELGSNLIRRYPGTVALFGFVSGVASFVLVERHAGLAKVVALVMLVSWLWLVLESSLRRSLQRWFGWQVPQPLLRYATQMVHQESLFFIIPFFAITTTWNSGQALFTGLLGLAALVSLIDPLYFPAKGKLLVFSRALLPVWDDKRAAGQVIQCLWPVPDPS